MNKQVKEPFLAAKIFNFILGIAVLVLFVLRIVTDTNTEIYEVLIFFIAAVENFIGATISFMQGRKFRGNVYAIVCTVFFIVALILAIRYFVFL